MRQICDLTRTKTCLLLEKFHFALKRTLSRQSLRDNMSIFRCQCVSRRARRCVVRVLSTAVSTSSACGCSRDVRRDGGRQPCTVTRTSRTCFELCVPGRDHGAKFVYLRIGLFLGADVRLPLFLQSLVYRQYDGVMENVSVAFRSLVRLNRRVHGVCEGFTGGSSDISSLDVR